jgi:hypothetical protein
MGISMGLNAIVTINFEEEVTTEKKVILSATLKKDGWVKASKTEDCWKTIFKDSATESAALNVTRHDVDRASKKAKIRKYRVVIQLGESFQESFEYF